MTEPAPVPHRTTIVGWTPGRVRRTKLLSLVVVLAGLGVAWAMFLPWAGLTIGAAEPTCDPHSVTSTVPIRGESGKPVEVAAAGCISAFHSVQNLAPSSTTPGSVAYAPQPEQGSVWSPGQQTDTATAYAAAGTPFGAPTPNVKLGIPAQTFWALMIAFMAVFSLLSRNGFAFLAVPLMAKFAFSDFATHRAALTWGLEGFGREMIGVSVHQWTFMALLGLTAGSAYLVFKGNHEQRKLDGRKHPLVVLFDYISGTVLRVGAEKLVQAQAAAKAGTAK